MFFSANFNRKKLDEVSILAYRMKTGLAKLYDAEKSVNELSLELVQKEKDLVVASKETDEVIQIALSGLLHICLDALYYYWCLKAFDCTF